MASSGLTTVKTPRRDISAPVGRHQRIHGIIYTTTSSRMTVASHVHGKDALAGRLYVTTRHLCMTMTSRSTIDHLTGQDIPTARDAVSAWSRTNHIRQMDLPGIKGRRHLLVGRHRYHTIGHTAAGPAQAAER